MPGQQDARHVARTDAGEQVGLASALVLDDQRFDTLARQQLADVVDQRQIRLRGDGVEGDQPFEDVQRPRSHDALLRGSAVLAKRLTWKGVIWLLVLPVLISSAITSPTPGPSWKPWPLKPKA
ncbi:hypothetical protein D9M71_634560 [compost metagenome]